LCDNVLSLQAVETNISESAAAAAAAAAYHVSEKEFISCRPITSFINFTVPAFTAYHPLQKAANYFIGDRCSFLVVTECHYVRHSVRPSVCPGS